MAYVTMEATMLICPAERFLYTLCCLQKGFFGGFVVVGGLSFVGFFVFGVFLGLQRSPVESYVVKLRVKANPRSCGIEISRIG